MARGGDARNGRHTSTGRHAMKILQDAKPDPDRLGRIKGSNVRGQEHPGRREP